jgi:hypothetical protein
MRSSGNNRSRQFESSPQQQKEKGIRPIYFFIFLFHIRIFLVELRVVKAKSIRSIELHWSVMKILGKENCYQAKKEEKKIMFACRRDWWSLSISTTDFDERRRFPIYFHFQKRRNKYTNFPVRKISYRFRPKQIKCGLHNILPRP